MDIDIVGDLNDGTDHTVAVHDGSSAHGADALALNDQKPVREPVQQAKKVGEAADPAAKPLSLRDQISSAIKSETETPLTAQQDGGPARNPDGTFAPKPADTGAQLPADQTAAQPVAAPAGIDPAVFASLPAETQATLARTMEDVTAQQQRVAWLSPLEQVITQDRIQAWGLNGMQPAQAVHQLLALSDFAGRDPAGFIQYMAQQNGVDLEELVLGMDGGEEVDPRYEAMQREIAELKGFAQGQTQQQQQAAHERTVNDVVAFASEKDQNGNVLRPYFEELGQAVMPYISMVKAQNPNWPHNQVLQEAYDRACWGTPSVRSKMQAAADAAGAAERLRAETARVESARTASASVRSGAPTAPPAAPNDATRSLRDTIRASIAQAQ